MPEKFLRKIDEYEENIRLNIVKKDFKDLGNKEITGKIYVVLDQKNNEEEIMLQYLQLGILMAKKEEKFF